MKKRILIIDDDIDMCILLNRFLSRNGYETDTAASAAKGIAKFKESTFDVVLCDYRLGDNNGKDVLKAIMDINPATIVLIITGYSDIKTAVDVIKMGAYDYITKPLIPDEVLNVLKMALSEPPASRPEARKAVTNGKPKPGSVSGDFYVGSSPSTKELYKQIALVAPTNYSVILYGESGTGKEVIAKTIHESSTRRDKPFIAMDCGTLSKELSGSELFGHVKGSFTGALNDKEGHFELANGGTLFLDEVANLSIEIQAALLRVIQERKLKRIGGTKEIDLDVRIIVASNENLQDAYKKGKFREDLYHRFNEFSISLPPLRARKDDIPSFADYFLSRTTVELQKEVAGFDDDVVPAFLNYPWPGNLREMRNVVRRAVLLTEAGAKISSRTLPPEISLTLNKAFSLVQDAGETEMVFQPAPKSSLDLKDTAAKAEYQAILSVLKEVNNNKSRAAEILKIDRKTLYNKIKHFQD